MQSPTKTIKNIEIRVKVLERVLCKEITQKEAAEVLEVSERQIRRLLQRYEQEGPSGLLHRSRNKPSNAALKPDLKARLIELLSDRFLNWGPSLITEYLKEHYSIKVSKETIRRLQFEMGQRKAKKNKVQKVHPPRPRRNQYGELIQIDGSPHHWFSHDRRHCLIAFIDDATSRIMMARFYEAETTQNYLDMIHDYVLEHGLPMAVYSDRHSIFTKHDKEDYVPTQFQRALEILGIQAILASSPQAKGRVERLNKTLQNRWVKAFEFHKVNCLEQANALVPQLIKAHNRQFGVIPNHPENAHVPYHGEKQWLRTVCSEWQKRLLSKNLTFSYRSQLYIIQTETQKASLRRGLVNQEVTVVDHRGNISVLLSKTGEPLRFKVFNAQRATSTQLSGKELDNFFHQLSRNAVINQKQFGQYFSFSHERDEAIRNAKALSKRIGLKNTFEKK